MDPAPHPPAAGQASVEYVAVLTVVAILLAFAAPAVGGPNIPRSVAHTIRLGICVVGGDICGSNAAKAAGLTPCPLNSTIKGGAGGLSIAVVDVGASGTLAVGHNSDGSVTAMLTTGGSVGVSGALGARASAGPVTFDAGASGGVAARIQSASGWSFPDEASARRFVDGLPGSLRDRKRFPEAWTSVEGGLEARVEAGVSAGLPTKEAPKQDAPGDGTAAAGEPAPSRDEGADRTLDGRVDLLGASAGAQGALGGRFARDGSVTIYARVGIDGPELSVAGLAPVGVGRLDVLAEYTYDRGGPRELVFRTASPSQRGNRITETAAHLDLREPGNLEVARRLLARPTPWSAVGELKAVLARIRETGTIERSVSDVQDSSHGGGFAVKLGLQIGVSGQVINVRRKLVDATTWVDGLERRRYDCVGLDAPA